MRVIHADGIIELTIKCPKCGKPIILIEDGKEASKKDRTCCGGYRIDLLHIAIIKK